MKSDGEISYDTPHAREVDRLSIPEWFEKRRISGLADQLFCAQPMSANTVWKSTSKARSTCC